MRTTSTNPFPDLAVAGSLILGPFFLLASGLVLPQLRDATGSELPVITEHFGAYYFFVLFGIIGSTFLIPAFLGLASRVAQTRPRLGTSAAILTVAGTCLGLIDWGTELVKWQMGAAGTDLAEMAALADRVDTTPGVAALLQLSGLCTLAGVITLAIGLVRSGSAPLLIGVGLAVGTTMNLGGFASGSILVLDIGGLALLASMGTLATRWTRHGTSAGDPRSTTTNDDRSSDSSAVVQRSATEG